MYKQAIVVRKDLKWGKGKLAAQAAHASVGAAMLCDQKLIDAWMEEGAKKVVLRVKDEKEMRAVQAAAKKIKLPCFLVRDAGKTQLKAGTVTALGVGPAKEREVDLATGKLKLL